MKRTGSAVKKQGERNVEQVIYMRVWQPMKYENY